MDSNIVIDFIYKFIRSIYNLLFCSFVNLLILRRDNLDAAVTSPELIAQTERLTLVLETRYVDDSLIPGMPESSLLIIFSYFLCYDHAFLI